MFNSVRLLIAKCFDKINHPKLLSKIGIKGKIRQQIKAWLKSGVLEDGRYYETGQGTPQGGVISPLLANIALHGLEIQLKEFISEIPLRFPSGRIMNRKQRRSSLSFIRYADDFVILHENKDVIYSCKLIVEEWLEGIGLELKPEKTRFTHTLNNELSEDGQAGFDFLGYQIHQYKVSKYKQHNNAGKKVEFKTYLIPSKKNQKAHYEKISNTIRKHKSSKQIALIDELNPIIRGWCNNFSYSDSTTKGIFGKMRNLTYLKLRAWGNDRCRTPGKAAKKYWCNNGSKDKWSFSTPDGFTLVNHNQFHSSSTKYIKVADSRSPFDGDHTYWATRLGSYPGVKTSVAILLKKQEGKCAWCEQYFKPWDNIE